MPREPGPGRRPNLTGSKKRPPLLCPRCGELRYLFGRGLCKPCYTKERPPPVGECAGCKRTVTLPRRGLCDKCARTLPPGSGVEGKRRAIGAEDGEGAERWHEAFVKEVMPRVRGLTYLRTAILSRQERMELLAEGVALAWEIFLQERKRGYNPMRSLRMFSKRVVGKLLSGRQIGGRLSLEDVLSPRRKGLRKCVVLRLAPRREPAYEAPTAAELDREAWLAKLSAAERRVVDFIRFGHNLKEAAREFSMRPKEVEGMMRSLWRKTPPPTRGAETE